MAQGGMNLEQQFANFSKFGDARSDGKTITLSQSDKWFTQAQIFDKRKVTFTDTGVCWNKYKSRTLDFKTFCKYLDDLAAAKKIPVEDFKSKLTGCGLPGTTKTTQGISGGGGTDTGQVTATK